MLIQRSRATGCAGSHRKSASILESMSMIDVSGANRAAMAGGKCQMAPNHRILVGFALAALLTLTGCSASVKVGPEAVAGLTPDGTVNMDQVQVAYLASAGGGSGTLYYQGAAYSFAVGGLGVGGIGASTIDAEGEVYKLGNLA